MRIKSWCRIPAAIATARIASTTKASNGWSARSRNSYRPSISWSPSRCRQNGGPLAEANQGVIYDRLLRCGWETLRTFSQNDKQLQGTPGAIAVLHTSTRRLDYHQIGRASCRERVLASV